MSSRARRPTDKLGTGVDMRGEYAPRRIVPPAEQATPTEIAEPPSRPDAVPLPRSAERSEPIRVISMKERTEAEQRRSDEVHVPLHVQLRSMAEVSRRRHDTPVAGLGHLAPPRDPREVRARRMRANLISACVAIVLAAAISLSIWLIAGR